MQHVRMATYDIKEGNFQEVADISRKGMLETFQEQPGFIRFGVADTGAHHEGPLLLAPCNYSTCRGS